MVLFEVIVNFELFVVSIGVIMGVFGDVCKEFFKVDKGFCVNFFGLRVCNFEIIFIFFFEEND